LARRVRRSIGPLDLRTQAILRAVIEEYVTTATPVGSQALVDRYRLGVSSATVRNILAELELAGLLGHPHTSAGRIPTDAGYRWYVESIIDSAPLPQVEQLMIRHQFGQVEFASEHWFRLAASTIASLTHAAGLATPAKPAAARVRRVDLVSINDRMASLVVILREGSIKQSLVSLGDTEDQAALTSVAAILNNQVGGGTAAEVEGQLAALDPALPHRDLVVRVGERMVRMLRDYDRTAVESSATGCST
jgi:heat-inducible transcriptional repressor